MAAAGEAAPEEEQQRQHWNRHRHQVFAPQGDVSMYQTAQSQAYRT